MGVQTHRGNTRWILELSLMMSSKVVFSRIWGTSKLVFHNADFVNHLVGCRTLKVSIHVLTGGLPVGC